MSYSFKQVDYSDFAPLVLNNNQGKNGITMDLLWTNPNPTSSFTVQTITVQGLSNYKLVLIEFKLDATGGDSHWSGICKQGSSSSVVYWNVDYNNVFSRMFYTGDDNIRFENTKKLSDKSTNNNVLIPVYVYGIK